MGTQMVILGGNGYIFLKLMQSNTTGLSKQSRDFWHNLTFLLRCTKKRKKSKVVKNPAALFVKNILIVRVNRVSN